MDWFPIVAGTFKVIALCTGMFFAVKWHYDQGKKVKAKEKGAVLRAGGLIAVAFLVALVGLVFLTFALSKKLGLDLSFP